MKIIDAFLLSEMIAIGADEMYIIEKHTLKQSNTV